MRPVALGALLSLVFAGAAAAEPVWLTPVEPPGGAEHVGDLALAMNGPGDAIVVWSEAKAIFEDARVLASTRSGGVFGAREELSPPDSEEPMPAVVLDDDGDAVAAWTRGYGSGDRIEIARRPAGGSFGAPLFVDGPLPGGPDVEDTGTGQARLALAPSGDVLVGWYKGCCRFLARTATLSAAGVLGPRVTLSDPDGSADEPRVAYGPDGQAVAVWTDIGDGYVGKAAFRPPGEAFSPGVPLPGADWPFGGSDVAVDAAGDTVVVWWERTGLDEYVVEAVIWPALGASGRAATLSEPFEDVGDPQVAVAGDGTATAVWSAYDGVRTVVQAATRPPGGRFGRPVELTLPRQSGSSPQLAVAPDGTTVVAWLHWAGRHNIVQAATRPPGGAFGRPVDLSAPDQEVYAPVRVAIGDTDDALVAWRQWPGRGRVMAVQTAAYDATPPRIDRVEVPASGIPGTAVPLSVAASDVSSPRVVTTWSFGDGTAGRGDTLSHVYVQPGSYEVQVTATDAAGRTTVATRAITIAPTTPLVQASPPVPAPLLSRLRVVPPAFRAAGSDAGAAARAPAGAHVEYRLDALSKVSFAVERRAAGRRVAGRCVAPARRNRGARRCLRSVAVSGGLTRWSIPGANRMAFGGRVAGRKLPPGRYALLATPTASAVHGETVRTAFWILPPARRARR